MTKQQWLLVAALVLIGVLIAIDMEWLDVKGNTHLPTWLGLSLAAYYGSLLVRDR